MDLVEIVPTIQGHLKRLRSSASVLADFRQARGRPPHDFARILEEIERQEQTANRRFTVAFVGMYNCGKSTILNSLLGLRGDERLSDQDSPDTARSIRIGYRTDPEGPECWLHFQDGTKEACTWAQAKGYTSEVYLEEHPAARQKAAQLVEVEYLRTDPLLLSLDFLDLPGTGTSNWRTHTPLTHQRLKEAELVCWVMGTCSPEAAQTDLEDLRILKEVKANVVPLINVWSDAEQGITGNVTPEAMEADLRSRFDAFFADGAPCFKYYAREIDLARQRGEEVREEWELERLVTYLSGLLGGETLRRERVRRLGSVIGSRLRRLEEMVAAEAELLAEVDRELVADDEELERQDDDRRQIGLRVTPRIVELADDCSRQIVTITGAAADAFIDDELRLTNGKMILEAITRREQEVVRERLRTRFENDFLHLAQRPNWIDHLFQRFVQDVQDVLAGAWARHLRDLQASASAAGFTGRVGTDFLDSAIGSLTGALLQRGALTVLVGVFGALLFVPGGFIIEVVSVLGLVLLQEFQDPLEKPRRAAKLRAKSTLDQNRYEIRNVFETEGRSLNGQLYEAVNNQLKARGQEHSRDRDSWKRADWELGALRAEVNSFREDMARFETGVFA